MSEQNEPAGSLFPDGPELPEMREGVFSQQELQQICADIIASTRVLDVQAKASGQSRAVQADDLFAAISQLSEGQCQAVQVHYQYDGAEWTDTMIGLGGRFRVVRCKHP